MIPQATNYAPVTLAAFASALTAVVIAFAQKKFGIDFAGQEANIQVLAVAAGYFIVKEAQ